MRAFELHLIYEVCAVQCFRRACPYPLDASALRLVLERLRAIDLTAQTSRIGFQTTQLDAGFRLTPHLRGMCRPMFQTCMPLPP